MLTGCGKQTTVTFNGSVAVSNGNGKVMLSNTKVYPGTSLRMKVEFDKPMKMVSYGFKNHIKVSTTKPENATWEDTVDIPNLASGEHELIVVATPTDNSSSKTFKTKIQVVNKPEFKVSYDPKQKSTQKIIVTGSGIKQVVLVDKTGLNYKLSKNKDSFTIDRIISSEDKLIITDINNIISEKTISDKQIFFYYLKHHPAKMIKDPNNGDKFICLNESYYTYCRRNVVTGEEKEYEKVEFPDVKDSFLESYILKSINGKKPSQTVTSFLSLSPNGRYCVYRSQCYLNLKDDIIESGRRLNTFSSFYTYLYNRKTKEYHLLNTQYSITYHPKPSDGCNVFKEIGSYLYPIYWKSNDELILVESVKDSELAKTSDFTKYPRLNGISVVYLCQSPKAKAKYVRLNTKDFSIETIEGCTPYTPWVSWSDQTLGLVGWMSLEEPFIGQDAIFPKPGDIDKYCIFVSDCTSSKVWNIREELIKQYGKEYQEVLTAIIGGAKWENEKSVLFSCLKSNDSGITYDSDSKEIFFLNIETGLISRSKKDTEMTKQEIDPDYTWSFIPKYNSINYSEAAFLAYASISPKLVDPEDPESPLRTNLLGYYLVSLKGNIFDIIGSMNDITSKKFLSTEEE